MSTGSDLKEFLRAFDALDSRKYEPGGYIWTTSGVVDSVFVLRRGQVCIGVCDSSGKPTIFRLIRPGELFGLAALTDPAEHFIHSSALATTPVEVVAIPHADFMARLRSNPDAAIECIKVVSAQLAEAEKRIRVLAEHGAAERLAALLVQIGFSLGHPSSAEGYRRIHCTHEELARMAALTRSHVSVLMAEFRDADLVRYARNRPIEIHTENVIRFLQRQDRKVETSLRETICSGEQNLMPPA